MPHPHHGDLFYIIVDDKTNEALRDSWADMITFNTEEDAQDYIDDFELENVHIETWLDY